MKNLARIVFTAVLCAVATEGYAIGISVAKTECNQSLTQAQTIKCGINAPVNINISGGGNVNFGAVQCAISAQMTAVQQAQCMAIAGKAGDIVTFAANELPQSVGVDLFSLGKITGKKEITNIAAPKDNGGVLFSFVTAEGLPINFLIKRNQFTKDDLNALGTETQADAAYKAKLAAQFPTNNSSMIATWYYRQVPGVDDKWTELWTDLDSPTNYPFAPKFNARIYPNGLVVLNKNVGRDPQTKQLFFVGDFQMQPSDVALGVPKGTTPTQIPIGGGKFVTPKDI